PATATPGAGSSASSTTTRRSRADRGARRNRSLRRALERVVALIAFDGRHRACGEDPGGDHGGRARRLLRGDPRDVRARGEPPAPAPRPDRRRAGTRPRVGARRRAGDPRAAADPAAGPRAVAPDAAAGARL